MIQLSYYKAEDDTYGGIGDVPIQRSGCFILDATAW